MEGPLPFGAKPIEKVSPAEYEHLVDFDPRNSARVLAQPLNTAGRPLAIIGFGADTGFTLFLNNLIGVTDRDLDGKPKHVGYTYVTHPGASGSPVFDIETGDLVAVHTKKLSVGEGSYIGEGVSIVSVIAAIQKDLNQPN